MVLIAVKRKNYLRLWTFFRRDPRVKTLDFAGGFPWGSSPTLSPENRKFQTGRIKQRPDKYSPIRNDT
jgi:hypothetical protein